MNAKINKNPEASTSVDSTVPQISVKLKESTVNTYTAIYERSMRNSTKKRLTTQDDFFGTLTFWTTPMKTTIYSRDKTINRREWWKLSHLANQTRGFLCELSKTGGHPQRAYCCAAIGLGFLRYVEWVKAQGK